MINYISNEKLLTLLLNIDNVNSLLIKNEITGGNVYSCFDLILFDKPEEQSGYKFALEKSFELERIFVSVFAGVELIIVCLKSKEVKKYILDKRKFIAILEKQNIYVHTVSEPVSFEYISSGLRRMIDDYNSNKASSEPKKSDVVNSNSTMVNPIEINSLVRLYEKGNFKRIEDEIDRIVENIRETSYYKNSLIAPTSIKRFFVEYILFVTHSAYDHGVDVDKELNYADPYQIIFSFDETPDIKNWCMEIMSRLYYASNTSGQGLKDNLAECVEHYIKSHLEEKNLSVSSIADNFKLSPAYLSSCYSTIRGTTIIKYLHDERMIAACSYLKNTSMTINEIIYKVGFISEGSFYSAFKKKYGLTPSEYRKNKQ